MSGKSIVLTEKQFKELMQELADWQEAAQSLAYLVAGMKDCGAAETLKFARSGLARLYEDIAHDVTCWQQVVDSPEVDDSLRDLARQQIRTLMLDTEGASQRLLANGSTR